MLSGNLSDQFSPKAPNSKAESLFPLAYGHELTQ
jgi:hypothetical protein